MPAHDRLALDGGRPAISGTHHASWPEITDADRSAVLGVLDRGVLAGANAPEITALQHEYAAFTRARFAVVTNSGTAALHCAAAAVPLGPGDEVLVPAFTFVASAMAMQHQGATPVFVDVDPRTYCLDPERIAERVTERTRALVAVHIHGQPADMDEINAIASQHGLTVIEDNAQAHGVTYRGAMAGTLGDHAGSSLSASKNLSAGEGGIFTTDDEAAARTARRLCVFGEDLQPLETRRFWSFGLGWNYRGQELSCALARSQLRRLPDYNARAEANAQRLTRALSGCRGVVTPYQHPDRGCSYWKYAMQVDTSQLGYTGDARALRDVLLQAFRAEGMHASVWQPHPVPAQPAFRRVASWDAQEFPVASRLCDVTVNLLSEQHPLYVQGPELIDRYAEAVTKVMSEIDRLVDRVSLTDRSDPTPPQVVAPER